ncbi:MAG: ATP-dependent DNA helicase PcrA, partial [Hominimerdicola sp.]
LSLASSEYSGNEVKPIHSMNLQQQLAMKRADKKSYSNDTQNFTAGERVMHKIFGEGTVLSATKMADDTLVEIAFDNKGTKKIMANYTKIKKI